jgi:predicted ATP-grasp superfamily ATP-dependent carboligase
MEPTAIVLNMFYSGLGIARSLGERGVPVIGLTAQRGIYGNFTRYAKVIHAPDSRKEPEALLRYLRGMGKGMKQRGVIFPTRDDDTVFLDRFREELQEFYSLVLPESGALHACLDKWETYQWAERAAVPTPKCWLVEGEEDLRRIRGELTFPCVLKAVAAHQWRKGSNWQTVGGRKAIAISSWDELSREYAVVSRAEKRVLLQEMIAGGDECLLIAACYLDRESKLVAGFNTQKLVQVPEGFGTGCIVRGVDRPEIFEPAARVLQAMRFTGIAEVEFKWDAAKGEFRLIEINPRPWDQHRLGHACGVDLIYLAYAEHAGLTRPAFHRQAPEYKWIAEDAFLLAAMQLLWTRNPQLGSLFRRARGKRIYAIWWARDPLPLLVYALARFLPSVAGSGVRAVWSLLRKRLPGGGKRGKGVVYEQHLGKEKSLS